MALISARYAFFAASAAAVILAGAAARAGQPDAMAAQAIHLGHVAGVAYYTEASDGLHLVATLAADEGATPVRFETILADGQHVRFSSPREAGKGAYEIDAIRVGGRVEFHELGLTD